MLCQRMCADASEAATDAGLSDLQELHKVLGLAGSTSIARMAGERNNTREKRTISRMREKSNLRKEGRKVRLNAASILAGSRISYWNSKLSGLTRFYAGQRMRCSRSSPREGERRQRKEGEGRGGDVFTRGVERAAVVLIARRGERWAASAG